MNKSKKIISIVLNSIVGLSMLYIMIYNIFIKEFDETLSFSGINYLKAFTNLSALFAGIVAIIVVIYNIKDLSNNNTIPRWLEKLHLIASTAEFVTFITVVVFLAPMYTAKYGYLFMFSNDMFHFHFLNCLISMGSYMFLNRNKKDNFKDILLGAIAVPIYSLYYLPLAIIDPVNDFYNFTFGGNYALIPIVIVIMYGSSLLFSFILAKVHNIKLASK